MKTATKLIYVLLLAFSCIFSLASHTLMEKLVHRAKFSRKARAAAAEEHEIVFALKQNNIDKLDELLAERSTPGNALYQKWLTFDEITKVIANPQASLELNTWLRDNQVNVTWSSIRGEYVKASASISKWEELLKTEFYEWEDSQDSSSRHTHHLAEHYSLPDHLVPHISAAFYTCQPPPIIFHHGQTRTTNIPEKSEFSAESVLQQLRKKKEKDPSVSTEATTVTNINYLKSYYGISNNIGSGSLSQSVFETSSQYFSQNDLAMFQSHMGLFSQRAIAPYGFETSSCAAGGTPNCDEGNLDLQYIMAVAQKTVSIYWYVGGGNPFVSWVTQAANQVHPPQSNSISWGSVEQDNSAVILTTFNTEALKLALMGVTIVASSGDHGVAGHGCPCDVSKPISSGNCACQATSSSTASNWPGAGSWSGSGYFPSFPATSPYVTAVGATMGSGGTPAQFGVTEIACQSQSGGLITSGGGFSTYFGQPAWQKNAVASYFTKASPAPVSGYNPLGRGIPDISMVGVAYEVAIGGKFSYLYGTSASAPVVAGYVSLVNAERLSKNLTSIGFINPTLYNGNYSSYFNDVTSGYNKCCANPAHATCCAAGFTATAGWDPVTGWGSIDFQPFAGMFNSSTPFSNSQSKKKESGIKLSIVGLVGIVILSAAILAAVGVILHYYCCRRYQIADSATTSQT